MQWLRRRKVQSVRARAGVQTYGFLTWKLFPSKTYQPPPTVRHCWVCASGVFLFVWCAQATAPDLSVLPPQEGPSWRAGQERAREDFPKYGAALGLLVLHPRSMAPSVVTPGYRNAPGVQGTWGCPGWGRRLHRGEVIENKTKTFISMDSVIRAKEASFSCRVYLGYLTGKQFSHLSSSHTWHRVSWWRAWAWVSESEQDSSVVPLPRSVSPGRFPSLTSFSFPICKVRMGYNPYV